MVNKNETTLTIEIDKIDRSIIFALQHDGQLALVQIGKQLDVSPGMIRVRNNRLVDMGILRIVAITNPLRMGSSSMALIGLKAQGEQLLEVADKIAALDEIFSLIVVNGAYEIIVEAVCRDQHHLLQFLLMSKFQQCGLF